MTPTRSSRGRAVAAVVALSLVVAACGGDDDDSAEPAAEEPAAEEPAAEEPAAEEPAAEEPAAEPATMPAECASVDQVDFVMQWVAQAQFAGYYVADELGFYEDFCLDVNIIEGGVEILPHQQLANGDVDFAIAWVLKALAVREAGGNIANIAQIFQRSGTLQVSFADSGIETPADFAGKKIGNWGFGNEYEIFAALAEAGLDPATDVDLVQQQFDMSGLLDGSIDAAEAMTYNEYAQVLETVNPDTGELYTPQDLSTISYEEIGVGMLQDAIWADGERLANDEAYKDIATRLVAASIQGWLHCRDNVQECVDIVLGVGTTLGASHQLWQMNEVNKLIWPSEQGIGYIIPDAWDRTVELGLNTPNLEGATIITEPPTDGAYTNEIVEAAWAILAEMGVPLHMQGAVYEPIEVTLNEGGN